jgi:undecaprenyl-diphosphatase
MFEKLLEWDQQTLIFINNSGSEQFDSFWLITTNFLTWIPLFIFIILLFFQAYRGKEVKWILLSMLSMLVMLAITIFLTKVNVARLRPVNDLELNSALRILTKPMDYSFFSGHAASSFSIAMLSILYLRKKIKWIYILLLWPILFAFSRMYLGVHYPLDILVGSIVGILFASIFYRMHQKFRAPYIM